MCVLVCIGRRSYPLEGSQQQPHHGEEYSATGFVHSQAPHSYKNHAFSHNSNTNQRHQLSHSDSERCSDRQLDPFNFSATTYLPAELIADVANCLTSQLDKYSLELLKVLIDMYRQLRQAGHEMAHHAATLSDRSTYSTSTTGGGSVAVASPVGAGDSSRANSTSVVGVEEYEALESLVCLRLAIACMHGRKCHHGLIRQR
jgi:hypothetical protein